MQGAEAPKQSPVKKPESTSDIMGPQLAVIDGAPHLLAVLFDGSSIFSEPSTLSGMFLGAWNYEIVCDTGYSGKIEDDVLAARVHEMFRSLGK